MIWGWTKSCNCATGLDSKVSERNPLFQPTRESRKWAPGAEEYGENPFKVTNFSPGLHAIPCPEALVPLRQQQWAPKTQTIYPCSGTEKRSLSGSEECRRNFYSFFLSFFSLSGPEGTLCAQLWEKGLKFWEKLWLLARGLRERTLGSQKCLGNSKDEKGADGNPLILYVNYYQSQTHPWVIHVQNRPEE